MASTALTLKTARELLDSRKGELARALVNRIDPEAFIRVAHMAMSKTPALLECTPSSLLMALMEAASLGLMPNGVLGHAYIIPYRNKGVMEAQFQPGYRGLIDLARRSGHVKSIVPRSVNENDRFQVEYGLEEKLVHVPNLDDPGGMRFVYAVAHLTDGGAQFHIMPIRDVERIRARSRAANNGPWITDFEAMAWKTVIKQMIKFLPLSLEADMAVQQDNAVEFGGDAPVFGPGVPEALPAATRTEALRDKVAARQIAPPAVDEEELEAKHAALQERVAREQAAAAGVAPEEPEAAPPARDSELAAFEEALETLVIEGGDATPRQRKALREIGELLYGAGTEESEGVRTLAESADLGREQAATLIPLGNAAVRAAAPPTPSAADAADPDALFGEG